MDIHVPGHNHYAPWVLAGGLLYSCTAPYKAVYLGIVDRKIPLFQVTLYEAVGGFVRQRRNGAGPKDLGLAEQLFREPVRPGLVFTGKIEVDIRLLIPLKSHEHFKGNVEAVLSKRCTTFRAGFVRKVRPRADASVFREFAVLALVAQVVRRQRVYLGYTTHGCNQRRPHRTPGPYQVPVLV